MIATLSSIVVLVAGLVVVVLKFLRQDQGRKSSAVVIY